MEDSRYCRDVLSKLRAAFWPSRPAHVLALAMILAAGTSALAQSMSVIHNFTGGDGMLPSAGLTIDRGGNFYGTTMTGGAGFGSVFKLSRSHSSWILAPLYSFPGGEYGANPQSRVVFGPDGSLYGTTRGGGNGFGTVFNLHPPQSVCTAVHCPWTLTTLYRFSGGPDGGAPEYGDLAFDSAGNIYGTTSGGGLQTCAGESCGVVYKLTRSGGSWTESVVYSFTGAADGGQPYSGVIFDNAGNVYGTASAGGAHSSGTIYQLSPSGSGWAETTMHAFDVSNDGFLPFGGLVPGPAGALYGTTYGGGTGGGGVVYQLQFSGGAWNFQVLHSFVGFDGSENDLTVDAAGNLYGTTLIAGTNNFGSVFKLGPPGHWTFTSLHDFTGGSDGAFPISNIAVDASGAVYGTAMFGGSQDTGVVFQIAPN